MCDFNNKIKTVRKVHFETERNESSSHKYQVEDFIVKTHFVSIPGEATWVALLVNQGNLFLEF